MSDARAYQAGDVVVLRDGTMARLIQKTADGWTLCPCDNDSNKKTVSADGIARLSMNEKQARDLIDRVPYVRTIPAPKDTAWVELLQDAMASCVALEWLQVIKSVYLRAKERPVPQRATELLEQARRNLYGELAHALGKTPDEMEDYITQSVRQSL